MKILIATFIKEPGGIAQAFLDYCETLTAQGHEVHSIIRSDMPLSFRKSVRRACHRMYHMNPKGYYGFFSLMKARWLIKHTKPDAIIAHGNRAASLLRRASLGTRTPCAAVSHSYNVKRAIGMDMVIALTEHMRKHIIKKGQPERRIAVIPNMVRMKNISPSTRLAKPPLTIGTMAYLGKHKGLNHLIKSLNKIKDIEAKIIIGGDGEERENLEALTKEQGLEDKVSFPGWITDKNAFYEQIDIFCLPSLSETFGIVLLEAMARKIPVIATRCDGPAQLITHEETGLLCDIASTTSLAHELKRLLSDEKLRKTLAENAYQMVTEQYEMGQVGKKLESVLKKLSK